MKIRVFSAFSGLLHEIISRLTFALIRWRRYQKQQISLKQKEKNAAIEIPPSCASVIIPVLDEADHIADVVEYALKDPATYEVIVIDDGSIDDTVILARAAGAKVFTSSMLGKGASMRDGVDIAAKELIVYLDGDLSELRPNIISDLCGPLLREDVDLVKASFGRSSGRVTELTAKPMIKIFFPELSGFTQPLGGIIAAKKTLLKQINFEDGYGVDIGILLDTFKNGGNITQVDIGSLKHDSQSLGDLTAMANEIGRVIFQRAKEMGRLHVEQVAAMSESQRQAAANISYILSRRKNRRKLLLLDMDGTVLKSRFLIELAKSTGKLDDVLEALQTNDANATTTIEYTHFLERSNKISNIFRFLHKKTFENLSKNIEIRDGVVEFVKEMRKQGFMVGIITDSYFIVAEIIRRRIFADFAIAHTLNFDNDVCDGSLQVNPAFVSKINGIQHVNKKNVLPYFLEDNPDMPFDEIWAIGDNLNDLDLLRSVDRAYAISPKVQELKNDDNIICLSSFREIMKLDKRFETAPTNAATEIKHCKSS